MADIEKRDRGLFHLTTGQKILGGLAVALMVLVIIGAVLSALSVLAVVIVLALVAGLLGALAIKSKVKDLNRPATHSLDSPETRKIDHRE